jgi:hypothetical protein
VCVPLCAERSERYHTKRKKKVKQKGGKKVRKQEIKEPKKEGNTN